MSHRETSVNLGAPAVAQRDASVLHRETSVNPGDAAVKPRAVGPGSADAGRVTVSRVLLVAQLPLEHMPASTAHRGATAYRATPAIALRGAPVKPGRDRMAQRDARARAADPGGGPRG